MIHDTDPTGTQRPLPFFREAARSVQCKLPFADRIAEAVLGERAMDCGLPGGLSQWWARRDSISTLIRIGLPRSRHSDRCAAEVQIVICAMLPAGCPAVAA
jgi:hypothetical protein